MSHNIPISNKTIFNIASVSKQFTVFAILLLEEEGKLSLQDDVRKYIPELKNLNYKITLEELARHTSGLKNFTSMARMSGWLPRDIVIHEQMLELVYRQQRVNFLPNSDYRYSNTGTLLLAEIVNRISGQTFSDFMKEKVFIPLKMKNTFIRDDERAIIKNLAKSYYWDYGVLKEGTSPYQSYGSTNVYSTTEDLSKWLLNMKSPIVGSTKMFDQMETQTELKDGTQVSHAMGQFITPYKGLTQVEHTGGHIFVTYLGRFKELDLGIALSSNNSDYNIRQTARSIADLFLETITTDYPSTEEVLVPKEMKLSSKELTSLEGNYWSNEDKLVRRIIARNDTLVYWRSENSESYFKPIAENTFQMLGETNEILLKFEKGKMIFDESTIFEKFTPIDYSEIDINKYEGLYYSEELGQSYELVIRDGKLFGKNPKMEIITLEPIMWDRFESNKWFLNLFEFKRDSLDKLLGFNASNYSVIDVWFEKIK